MALEIAASWIAAITPLYADAGGTLAALGIGRVLCSGAVQAVAVCLPVRLPQACPGSLAPR